MLQVKINDLEQCKVSIPYEKQVVATQMIAGQSFVTSDVSKIYKNTYIPELELSTGTMEKVITMLERDKNQFAPILQQLNSAQHIAETEVTHQTTTNQTAPVQTEEGHSSFYHP